MITCPSCHSQEMMGALFCSECGAQLIQGMPPDQEVNKRGPGKSSEEQNHGYRPISHEEETLIYLQILENGQVIALSGREEFTLGRINGDQPIIPDIDLSPYGGYEQGVSRLHATILINEIGAMLTDLGSVNGTEINGKEIPVHRSQHLNNGDVLTLGKMKMKVIIRN